MTKQLDTSPLPTQPELLGLVHASPAPLWIAHANGERRYFNPAWYSLTGRSLETEQGWGWLEHIHVEDRERLERTIQNALRVKRDFRTRYRLACRHNEWRDLEEHGWPVLAEGRVLYWLGTCRDTTQEAREHGHYRDHVALTNAVARAKTRREALETIILAFETANRKVAVFLFDSDGMPQLEAAPSLSELSLEVSSQYIRQAVRTDKPVIVSDLVGQSTGRGFALPNSAASLPALWALPIPTPFPGVLAVFYTSPTLPSDEQVEDLSPWTVLVSLALRVQYMQQEESND